jgi:hypothetical protein
MLVGLLAALCLAVMLSNSTACAHVSSWIEAARLEVGWTCPNVRPCHVEQRVFRRCHRGHGPSWTSSRPLEPEGTNTMSIELFRDDDRGYLAWLAANAQGYVLNIQRSLNPSDARMHKSNCRTINGMPSRGSSWTSPYVKVCSGSLTDLGAWGLAIVGKTITRCGICRPGLS